MILKKLYSENNCRLQRLETDDSLAQITIYYC